MSNLTTYSQSAEELGFNQPEMSPDTNSVHVDQGAIRVNLTTGQQEQSGVTRFSSADVAPENIFATAQNSAGFPTGDRSPTTTIELEPGNPGSRVSIQVAEALGFIAKNEYGQYVQKGQAQATPQDAVEAAAGNAGGPELFEPQQEEALAASVAAIPAPVLDQAVAKAAASIATGDGMGDFAADISSTTGIPEEQLRETQESLRATFQAQADAAIQKLGVDPQDLYAWARANHPQELSRAVREQLFSRSLDVYRSLADAYQRSVPPSLDSISQKYSTTAATGRGTRDMVTINGMQMEVKTAARMGLI